MLPFTVQRIDHLVFRVRDLQRSVSLYSNVLDARSLAGEMTWA